MTKTEASIKEIILPVVESLGYSLYDVMYLKEGSDYYLRLFIDKPDKTIDLDDCEKVSNSVSDKLDEVDPIVDPYHLEVSSCGVERHLREPEHFNMYKGQEVSCKMFKSVGGQNEFVGKIVECDGTNVVLDLGENKITLKLQDISSCKKIYNWEESENE